MGDLVSGRPGAERPVLDATGLRGKYLVSLHWDDMQEFLFAMQEQLGLRLEPRIVPVDTLVIDHVEKPEAT